MSWLVPSCYIFLFIIYVNNYNSGTKIIIFFLEFLKFRFQKYIFLIPRHFSQIILYHTTVETPRKFMEPEKCNPKQNAVNGFTRPRLNSNPNSVLVTAGFAHGQFTRGRFARGQFAQNGPPKVRLG